MGFCNWRCGSLCNPVSFVFSSRRRQTRCALVTGVQTCALPIYPSDMSRINLTDDADTMMQKIRKARTDPEVLPSEAAGLEGRAEARNLVGKIGRASCRGSGCQKV